METNNLSQYFEDRLSHTYLRKRISIENANDARRSNQANSYFGLRNLSSPRFLIEWLLKLSGMYWRGAKNAVQIKKKINVISSPLLPQSFDGYVILHLSDLHSDISEPAMKRLCELVHSEPYDLCVMTGDYRGRTWGSYINALERMAEIRHSLRGNIYAVLGNHDSIGMVPALEAMGIRTLINEHQSIVSGEDQIYLAGIDDAHYFHTEDIDKAASAIPRDGFSILLSHTPEIYRKAAHAGFNVMLSGHTHGGQICLPGGIPLRLGCVLPSKMGSGAWRHGTMVGYTSVGAGTSIVPVRFNCQPEITFHRLERTKMDQNH
jgi:predicted MPP superfamily phosphohydrolase